jgi:hypothetical protein
MGLISSAVHQSATHRLASVVQKHYAMLARMQCSTHPFLQAVPITVLALCCACMDCCAN